MQSKDGYNPAGYGSTFTGTFVQDAESELSQFCTNRYMMDHIFKNQQAEETRRRLDEDNSPSASLPYGNCDQLLVYCEEIDTQPEYMYCRNNEDPESNEIVEDLSNARYLECIRNGVLALRSRDAQDGGPVNCGAAYDYFKHCEPTIPAQYADQPTDMCHKEDADQTFVKFENMAECISAMYFRHCINENNAVDVNNCIARMSFSDEDLEDSYSACQVTVSLGVTQCGPIGDDVPTMFNAIGDECQQQYPGSEMTWDTWCGTDCANPVRIATEFDTIATHTLTAWGCLLCIQVFLVTAWKYDEGCWTGIYDKDRTCPCCWQMVTFVAWYTYVILLYLAFSLSSIVSASATVGHLVFVREIGVWRSWVILIESIVRTYLGYRFMLQGQYNQDKYGTDMVEGGWNTYRFRPWLVPAVTAVIILVGIILKEPNIFKPSKMRNQKKQNKKRKKYIEEQNKKAGAHISQPEKNFTIQKELTIHAFDVNDSVLVQIDPDDRAVWVPAVVIAKQDEGGTYHLQIEDHEKYNVKRDHFNIKAEYIKSTSKTHPQMIYGASSYLKRESTLRKIRRSISSVGGFITSKSLRQMPPEFYQTMRKPMSLNTTDDVGEPGPQIRPELMVLAADTSEAPDKLPTVPYEPNEYMIEVKAQQKKRAEEEQKKLNDKRRELQEKYKRECPHKIHVSGIGEYSGVFEMVMEEVAEGVEARPTIFKERPEYQAKDGGAIFRFNGFFWVLDLQEGLEEEDQGILYIESDSIDPWHANEKAAERIKKPRKLKPKPTGMARFLACHAKLPELEDSISELAEETKPGWYAIDEFGEWTDKGKLKIEVIRKQVPRVQTGDVIRVMGIKAIVRNVTENDIVVAETDLGTVVTFPNGGNKPIAAPPPQKPRNYNVDDIVNIKGVGRGIVKSLPPANETEDPSLFVELDNGTVLMLPKPQQYFPFKRAPLPKEVIQPPAKVGEPSKYSDNYYSSSYGTTFRPLKTDSEFPSQFNSEGAGVISEFNPPERVEDSISEGGDEMEPLTTPSTRHHAGTTWTMGGKIAERNQSILKKADSGDATFQKKVTFKEAPELSELSVVNRADNALSVSIFKNQNDDLDRLHSLSVNSTPFSSNEVPDTLDSHMAGAASPFSDRSSISQYDMPSAIRVAMGGASDDDTSDYIYTSGEEDDRRLSAPPRLSSFEAKILPGSRDSEAAMRALHHRLKTEHDLLKAAEKQDNMTEESVQEMLAMHEKLKAEHPTTSSGATQADSEFSSSSFPTATRLAAKSRASIREQQQLIAMMQRDHEERNETVVTSGIELELSHSDMSLTDQSGSHSDDSVYLIHEHTLPASVRNYEQTPRGSNAKPKFNFDNLNATPANVSIGSEHFSDQGSIVCLDPVQTPQKRIPVRRESASAVSVSSSESSSSSSSGELVLVKPLMVTETFTTRGSPSETILEGQLLELKASEPGFILVDGEDLKFCQWIGKTEIESVQFVNPEHRPDWVVQYDSERVAYIDDDEREVTPEPLDNDVIRADIPPPDAVEIDVNDTAEVDSDSESRLLATSLQADPRIANDDSVEIVGDVHVAEDSLQSEKDVEEDLSDKEVEQTDTLQVEDAQSDPEVEADIIIEESVSDSDSSSSSDFIEWRQATEQFETVGNPSQIIEVGTKLQIVENDDDKFWLVDSNEFACKLWVAKADWDKLELIEVESSVSECSSSLQKRISILDEDVKEAVADVRKDEDELDHMMNSHEETRRRSEESVAEYQSADSEITIVNNDEKNERKSEVDPEESAAGIETAQTEILDNPDIHEPVERVNIVAKRDPMGMKRHPSVPSVPEPRSPTKRKPGVNESDPNFERIELKREPIAPP